MADEANTPNLRLCKLRRFTGEGDCAETFIQEAKLILQLQTVPALAAAAWILGALDGRARQEVIRRPAAEVNTPAKIYSILEQTWGDQRDSVALAAAFHRRQQGLGESVSEYASHLRAAWAKTNAAEANTLNDNTLRKTFATGLHPQSMKRDMCRFLREKPAATFDEVLFCGCVTLMELCGAHLVIGWQGAWRGKRLFPLDMAGFSEGVDFLLQHPTAYFSDTVKPGYLEDDFLRSGFGLTIAQLTPGTDPDCNEVLVWHTQTGIPKVYLPRRFALKSSGNLGTPNVTGT